METGSVILRRGRGKASRLFISIRLGDGWQVEYRLRKQQERHVVEELRIFLSPESEPLPLGGLPARVVKQVTLGAAYEALRDYAKSILEGRSRDGGSGQYLSPDEAREHWDRLVAEPLEAFDEAAPRRPGRAGRPDLFYARIAESYVRFVRAGSRSPVKDLAKALRSYGDWYSDGTVSQLVFTARDRDLLSPSPVGRAGGDLTPKARGLLSKEGRNVK
jgi:hypothetical protein